MIVSAREFTSTAELLASAAAVRDRCFHPKARPVAKAIPAAVPVPRPALIGRIRPYWMLVPTLFDEHVTAYRVALQLKEIQARNESEVLASAPKRTIREIVDEVLLEFPQFTVADLKSSRRTRDVCFARQTAMYEIRKERPNLSFPEIGRWFGGRDHTTVLHSVTKIAALRGEA